MHSEPGHAWQGCMALMPPLLPANNTYFLCWKSWLMVEQP